jgi:hypothetical protein
METDSIIREYHAEYCRATGLQVKYGMDHYTDWYLFAKQFEVGDIFIVVEYLKKLYRHEPEILKACLRLSKLIRERSRFAEYLAEAMAEARKPKVTERDRVLAATGRPREPGDNTRTPAQILAGGGPPASATHSSTQEATAVLPSDVEQFLKEHEEWKRRKAK